MIFLERSEPLPQNEEISRRFITSRHFVWLSGGNRPTETQFNCKFSCEGFQTIEKMIATGPHIEMDTNFEGRSTGAYHAAPISPEEAADKSWPKCSPKMAVLAVFGTIALLFPYIAIPVIFSLWKREASSTAVS
jgi:hypothetical protein